MDVDRLGAFGYPFGGEDREQPVVVGWILLLLAFLVPVVPAVPFLGYLVRVVRASEREEPAPGFRRDLAGLLRESAAAVVVCVGYLLVPVVLLLVTVYGAVTASTTPNLGFTGGLVVYGGSTVVLGLAVLGGYLLPIGLALYAREGSLGAAFSPGELRPIATHAAYFSRWTGGAVALSLSISVANLVSATPRVGPVVAALVLSYGSILSVHVWGRAVATARAR